MPGSERCSCFGSSVW